MDAWLDSARRSLAEEVGGPPAEYELTEGEVERLLELARIAAHDSGQRTNAPLVSYLVGLAHGRHSDRTLEQLVAAALRSAT